MLADDLTTAASRSGLQVRGRGVLLGSASFDADRSEVTPAHWLGDGRSADAIMLKWLQRRGFAFGQRDLGDIQHH
jgi:hypothetical protein